MKATFLLFVAVMPFVSYAGEEVQTDWSGGSGILGPVTEWQNEFYTCLNVECFISPGELCLEPDPFENIVADNVNGAWCVQAANLNNDDYMDVIAAARWAGNIHYFINLDGSGSTWTHGIVGSGSGMETVCANDFDGDGNVDVAGAANDSGEIAVWLNKNGGGSYWSNFMVDDDFDGANSVHSSDMDGDGDIDVLGSAYESSSIRWWENLDGTGENWLSHAVTLNFTGVKCAYGADLDGDGDIDVIGCREGNHTISWWENADGIGTTWTWQDISNDLDAVNEIRSGDIDGDGDDDVIGALTLMHRVSWWENLEGTGDSWLEHEVCEYLHKPYTIHVEDIDGDGDIDIVAGSRSGERVSWYDNIFGDGSSWNEHVVDPYASEPSSVSAADLNGDGLCDILCAEIASDQVVWWSFTSYPSTGYATSSILNLEEEPQWLAVDWSGEEPPGTETVFQFRTGKNPMNLGYWTEYMYEPCNLSDIVSSGDTLFQYRVRFFTDNSLVTPFLNDFLVSWDPNGCSGEEGSPIIFRVVPNPVISGNTFSLNLDASTGTEIEFVIRDLAGRTVSSGDSCLEHHQSGIELIAPRTGLYFVTVSIGGSRHTRRLAVI